MKSALKARLDALRKKVAPAKPKPTVHKVPAAIAPRKPQAHKVIVQAKVVAPRKMAPENPKHTSVVVAKTAQQHRVVQAVVNAAIRDEAKHPKAVAEFEHVLKEVWGTPMLPLIKPTIENAIVLVQQAGIAYASLFTTRMGAHDKHIGVADAFALLDKLEEKGVIGPAENLELRGASYRKVYNLKPGGVK